MRQKLDKVQSKLYMPSQDQIIGGMNSAGQPHNIIRGAAQNFEMNRPLEHEFTGEGEESPHTNQNMRDQEWAMELRKADERSHEIRLRCEDFVKKNQTLEEKTKQLEEKIEVRDTEILRLGNLYQGGQNNDRLTLQYQQDQNKKILVKLQSQIDFLNKENHRLQT
jgi:hypothetical protein